MTDTPRTEEEIMVHVIADLRQTFGSDPVPVKVSQVAQVAISGYRRHLRAAGLAVVDVEKLKLLQQRAAPRPTATFDDRIGDLMHIDDALRLMIPAAPSQEDTDPAHPADRRKE